MDFSGEPCAPASKPSGRADLSAIVAPETATAAALYTTNKIQAAPLLIDRRHLAANAGRIHTVLINAGNANCATGDAGITAAEQCCDAAAEAFGCDPQAVFPSSTGIIGVPLPVEKVRAALPALSAAVGDTLGPLRQRRRRHHDHRHAAQDRPRHRRRSTAGRSASPASPRAPA